MKQGVDHIGVTVVFYCHDGKGNILLHKRSKNCRDEQGKWDCGGGALEFGEDWESAVKREVKEEYGCNIQKLRFITANNVLRTQDGKQTHWIALLFAIQVNPQEIRIGNPQKMDKIGWFPFRKLPTPLHSMFRQHFELVKKAGGFDI